MHTQKVRPSLLGHPLELLLELLLEGVVLVLIVPAGVIPILLPLLRVHDRHGGLPIRLVELLEFILLIEARFGLIHWGAALGFLLLRSCLLVLVHHRDPRVCNSTTEETAPH